MISTDRDALVCDLAETYGIFDYKALPVSLLATLSSGLGDDSRIKRKIAGSTATKTEILLAAAVDLLSLLWWAQTEDGQNGNNRPASIVDILLDSHQGEYRDADDYEDAWERITGVRHG